MDKIQIGDVYEDSFGVPWVILNEGRVHDAENARHNMLEGGHKEWTLTHRLLPVAVGDIPAVKEAFLDVFNNLKGLEHAPDTFYEFKRLYKALNVDDI